MRLASGLRMMLVLCALSTTAACSSMRTVRLQSGPAAPFAEVKPGDQVTAVTRDGRVSRFVVKAVAGDELVASNGDRYHRDELARLERKVFSPGRTALLAGGLCLGAAILTGAIFAAIFA